MRCSSLSLPFLDDPFFLHNLLFLSDPFFLRSFLFLSNDPLSARPIGFPATRFAIDFTHYIVHLFFAAKSHNCGTRFFVLGRCLGDMGIFGVEFVGVRKDFLDQRIPRLP